MNQAISISSTRENPTAIIICAFRTLAIAGQILRDFVFAEFILVNKHPKHEQQPSNRNFLPLRRHHHLNGDDLSRNLVPSLTITPAIMPRRQLSSDPHTSASPSSHRAPMTSAYAADAGTPSIQTFPVPSPSHTSPEITPYGIPAHNTGDVCCQQRLFKAVDPGDPHQRDATSNTCNGPKTWPQQPGPDLVFVSDSGSVR